MELEYGLHCMVHNPHLNGHMRPLLLKPPEGCHSRAIHLVHQQRGTGGELATGFLLVHILFGLEVQDLLGEAAKLVKGAEVELHSAPSFSA